MSSVERFSLGEYSQCLNSLTLSPDTSEPCRVGNGAVNICLKNIDNQKYYTFHRESNCECIQKLNDIKRQQDEMNETFQKSLVG